MATEMECNNSRPSSPSLTQDKETCETLRLMNERLRILKMQHEDAYSHVCHIESRYMDRESDFYKGAYGLYLTAKEAAEEAEDAPRPQMAPPKTSKSELQAQNEARYFKKQPFNNPPQYNRHGKYTAQPIDLLFILADLLNKYPGLAQQLPRIAAVKNSRNQKYAIIEALLDSESYV
ncbi:hypothetical protein NPIL_268941 [Nephila pilipes]|uniref:Uncharacterized protein n=1 Tax=Nephila pilipes TaxID=299642 RepID=A0A8X6MY39_NEPPI|nr:hypothetical protein NPIL_268941 [Nephila pilipes]